MSNSIDSNGVITVVGDGFGVNYGRKQLVAAPSTAVKMQLVFRAYFTDGSTNVNGVQYTAKPWDSCSFFGLGFDNSIYDFAAANTIAPDGFFGFATTTKPYVAGPTYDNARKSYHYANLTVASPAIGLGSLTGTLSGTQQKYGWLDGTGVIRSEQAYGYTSGNAAELMGFPVSATLGAYVTVAWEIYGSLIDKTVYCRRVFDRTSIAEGDGMFAAFDGKSNGTSEGNISLTTIHGDVTSNWRNSDDTMNFPRWLKYKYSFPDFTLVIKYWKVRYLDATDTVVREQVS